MIVAICVVMDGLSKTGKKKQVGRDYGLRTRIQLVEKYY